MKVTIHTDGSSRGNPGPGGWGTIIETKDEVMELGGRESMTTNNRMELMAAIQGLKEIDDSWQTTDNREFKIKEIEVFTDSQYVKKGISEWIEGWIRNGWKGSTKKAVLNQDLWEMLKKEEDRLKSRGVKMSWKYVPGHSGIILNERADVIATACADGINLELYRGKKEEYKVL